MGMKVDDARSDGEAADIEDVIGISIDPANGLNATIINCDIAEKRRHAGAIVNAAAFENQIVHGFTSMVSGSARRHEGSRIIIFANFMLLAVVQR